MSNKSKIILVDPEKCSGCNLCRLACSFKNKGIFSSTISLIQLVKIYKCGINIPIICQHCAKPPCEYVCPTNAIFRDEDTGVVLLDKNKCIGCYSCFNICPIGAIQIEIESGRMIKCDLCEGDPECVKACKYGALSFYEINQASEKKRREGIKKISEVYERIIIK